MRVIAGSAGGLRLKVPDGDIRPTMDLVKGAIFSSLGLSVRGARVLDLFAGSGALGIEALSRGAASAVFVDSSRKASACIETNLETTRLTGLVRLGDAWNVLATLEGSFDLVFADPPYPKAPGDRDHGAALLASPDLLRILAPPGFFILEAPSGTGIVPTPPWSLLRSKRHGKTEFYFFTPSRASGET